MKFAILMKTVSTILIAVYACMNFPSVVRSHETKNKLRTPRFVKGKVRRLMEDCDYFYLLIDSGDETVWVATVLDPPPVGNVVECSLDRCIDAYESKDLIMAFEEMYFTDEFKKSETGGDETLI